jgi:superoxide dismutase, Cu-Zn family
MRHLILAAGLLCAAAAAPVAAMAQAPAGPQHATATLINAEGHRIGQATLTQMPGGIVIQLEARNLPPGPHGFHVHATGRCDAADGFESAGDHFNPRHREHGFGVANGAHAGDLPNQVVGPDGTLRAEVFGVNLTLGSGGVALLDTDGAALVLHTRPDDHRSQPSGETGDRIACGVIEPQR